MPWREMTLRDARVWARCDDSGQLVAQGGRVEVRYKPTDPKAYRAGVANLGPSSDRTIYPDAHCAEASAADSESPKRGSRSSGSTSASLRAPTEPPPGGVLAYTDGACSGNPGPAGVGVVLLRESGREELSEYVGEGTNNIAELVAIQRALEFAGEGPLVVCTDSTYAIGVLVKNWKAKANVELIAEIRALLRKRHDVTLVHVRGHQGVKWNERADELAVSAVQGRRTAPWLKAKR